MLRNRRVRVLIAVAGGGLIAAAGSLVPGPSSASVVCAETHAWVGGVRTPIAGSCVPGPSGWFDNCAGVDVPPLGYGAGASACVPTPV